MDPEVRAFYVDGFREDERLRLRAHGVLERVRTQELLARLLPPPPATVLDVGGGTGVHADWLAQRGYSRGRIRYRGRRYGGRFRGRPQAY